jgi:hypothetical protein
VRTFIVVVVASLIPAGMWVAGCRQDTRQAAFPNSSEIESLARAPESASPTTPPVIHAAPIDRSILNLPEAPTMARVNAVNDRSRQIARSKTPDELFTLPGEEDRYAMAAPAPYEAAAAPAAITPIPSAREFWSRPVAQVEQRRPAGIPSDIAAMAAPAPIGGGGGSRAILPPAPFLAPIPSNEGGQFIPEDVPGVFMGGQPLSMRRGSPPTDQPRFSGRSRSSDAQGAALLSSSATASMPEQGGLFTLDISGLVGASPGREMETESRAAVPAIDRTIVVQSIPGDYEPLPEPVPLAEYTAAKLKEMQSSDFAAPAPAPASVSVPVPAAAGAIAAPPVSAAPAAPVSFNALTAQPPIPARKANSVPSSPALSKAGDIASALAPLPNIADADAIAVQTPSRTKAPVALPSPVPEPMQTPELAAAKTALKRLDDPDDMDSLRHDSGREPEIASNRDVFRMDFQKQGPDSAPKAKQSPRSMEETPLWMDDIIPEIREPAKEAVNVVSKKREKPASRPSAPKKIKLHPVRKADSGMGRIDSAAEAPPLRF